MITTRVLSGIFLVFNILKGTCMMRNLYNLDSAMSACLSYSEKFTWANTDLTLCNFILLYIGNRDREAHFTSGQICICRRI